MSRTRIEAGTTEDPAKIPDSDFKTLFRSLPGRFLILDPSLSVVAVSDAFLRATMTSRPEILGRNVFEVFPSNPEASEPTGESVLRASLERVARTHEPDAMRILKYDIRRPGEEGGEFEERYWSSVNWPVLSTEGSLRYIVHQAEDITDFVQVRHEEEQRNRSPDASKVEIGSDETDLYLQSRLVQAINRQLQARNEVLSAEISERERVETELHLRRRELQTYIDSMTTLNAKIALDGTFLLVNKIGAQASGLDPNNLGDTNFLEGPWWASDPLAHDRVREAFRKACEGTTVNYEEKLYIFGRMVDIDFNLAPVWGEDGRVESVVVEARDIRKRKEFEHDLTLRTRQLEVANEELEAFSYAVSHDLRAPLRSIDGFSHALLEDYEPVLDERGRGYLQRVRKAAQRMSRLIDDLLDLSRLSRSEMAFGEVDLSQIATAVYEDLAKAYPNREVDVRIEEGVVAYGDAALLKILLTNLIGNAWKFTGKREDARIEFGVEPVDGEVAFYVRDNGVGFEMEYADRLFGAFQRLHSMNEFDGTGIGLATAQRIVQRHGGRLWAVGEVGRGATFYFVLPAEG